MSLSFKAEDIHYIKGRGLVFYGYFNQQVSCDYCGEVIINGKGCGDLFNVIGFEMFSIARPGNVIVAHEKIGVLVNNSIVYNNEKEK